MTVTPGAWDDHAARFGTHDGDLIGTLDAPMAALHTLLAAQDLAGWT